MTLQRIGTALAATGRDYVADDLAGQLVVNAERATIYIDLQDSVLRCRSVWRGTCDERNITPAIALVLRWNREHPGPKVVVHFDSPYRLTAHSAYLVADGLDDLQLQATILLALILSANFFRALEAQVGTDFAAASGSHSQLFVDQETPPAHPLPGSDTQPDNNQVCGVDFSRLQAACQRLEVDYDSADRLLCLCNEGEDFQLRLFGDNTWLSLAGTWPGELPRQQGPRLFQAANRINAATTFPVLSIIGAGEYLTARADHIVNVGEGLTDQQLDTQVALGLGAVRSALENLETCLQGA